MATRTTHRGWTRPESTDPARIEDTVSVPLDDADRDVHGIAGDVAAIQAEIALPKRAVGVFVASAYSPSARAFVGLTTQEVDTDDWYDAAGRFTPQIAGYYFFAATGRAVDCRNIGQLYISKNGDPQVVASSQGPALSQPLGSYFDVGVSVSGVALANGTTDYFEAIFTTHDGLFHAMSARWSGFLIGRT